MALKKITGKDFKEAVDWLWGHKAEGGCVHQVLGTTNDGTKLCFVVGWSKGTDYSDDDKKYGYFDEGYCISAKIGYQHRNNAMQTDYDWDFNMPYDLETGDVWDTSSYVPRDADWEREAADYNKEAEKIWAAYGDPDGKNFWDDDKAPLDLMESKKSSEAKKHTCSMQKKKESLAKQNEYRRGELDFRGGFDFNGKPKKSVISKISKALDKAGISAVVNPSGERLEVPFGDDAVYMTAMSQSYGSNKCSYVNVRQKSDRNTDVGVYNVGDAVKVVQEITQGLGAPNESKNHTCSMQKKKESLAKKSEAYGDFNISDEDVKLTVNYVDVDSHGGSFSVDTPKDGQSYSLQEMKDMVKGMCEDCSGYADISRDGSDILIVVMAPETDENGEFANDYYAAYTVRCTVRIISTSLETFVDYLDKYNAE